MRQRARLILSFSPNPGCRNQQRDTPRYVDVPLRELNSVGTTVQLLKARWITEQGQVRDQMEEPVNTVIRPREQALFPELWVSSAPTRCTYRVRLIGLDGRGKR